MSGPVFLKRECMTNMDKTQKPLTGFNFLKLVFLESPARVLTSIFCAIAGEGLEGIGFMLFLPLIQAFTSASNASPGDSFKFLKDFMPHFLDRMSILTLLALIVFVFAVKNLFLYISKLFTERIAVEFEENLKKEFVASNFAANLDFYLGNKIGTFLGATTNQAHSAAQAFSQLMQLCAGIFNILVYCVVGFLISWRMFLLCAAGGVLSFLLMKNVINASRKAARSVVGIKNECQSALLENFSALKFIKGNHLVEMRKEGLFRLFDVLKETDFKNHKYQAIVNTLPDFMIALVMCVVFYVSYVYFKVPGSNILVLSALLYQVNRRILAVQAARQKLAVQLPSFEFCRSLIEDAKRAKEEAGREEFIALKEGLKFEGVSFSFGRESVLGSVTLEIKKNELTALVGKSGSGKTTILDLIMGLFRPQQGNLRLDGCALAEYNIFSWREKISYIPQEPVLFNGTIEENIRVGKTAVTKEDVVRVAKLAYVDEFVDKLPEKYQTLVGDRGVKLSGGQRQRVALARALIRDPQILILDEATSALDNESERMVRCALDALRGKLTILVVAHRLTTIENADMIYVLDGGEIVESGKAEALVSNRQIFHTLYGGERSA